MDSAKSNDDINDNDKCKSVDNPVNNCDSANFKKRERRFSNGSDNISEVKRERRLSTDSTKSDDPQNSNLDVAELEKRLTENNEHNGSSDNVNEAVDLEVPLLDRLRSSPGTSDTCARIKIYKNRSYRHHSQSDETTQTGSIERADETFSETSHNVDASDSAQEDGTVRDNNPDIDNSNTVSLNESESEIEEEEGNDDDDDDVKSLIKQPPKPNWFPVQEIIKRQIGYKLNRQSSILFQQRCYGSLHCVKRLQLFHKMEKHQGCVNCLNFHQDGTLLASGSDDLKIVIWDWKRGKPLISFDSKHKENVFQCKFLPLSGDLHIASCARDGQVRLSQISIQDGLRSNRMLFSHRKSCHKLAVLKSQPHVILSAGEDGIVMSQDVRESNPNLLVTVDGSERGSVVPLYSINSHPLNTYEFCVSGQDAHVRSYDQRKCNSPFNVYYAPTPSTNAANGLDKIQVSCAVYNYNGSEILASYNDGDIFLFDANGTPGTFAHRYQGHRNAATIKGVNFFGPKSEFIVSGSDCGNMFFWEKNTEAIVNYMSADESGVVNCLEPHPQLPFICTSGLDADVKVWMPLAPEDATLPDLVAQLKANKNFTSLMMGHLSEDQMLWLLWRRLYHTENELDNLLNDIQSDNGEFLSSRSSSSGNSDGSNEAEEEYQSGCYNS